ncbi:glycoside hydrolase family 43 protein [Agromyces aureus]|uniref:Beta-xylosidase C-terminal Concanavalin A-like domain-containing protein n=1 Tax=Agromyces aureus TaxID=453304 RepID=A0A191WDB5_9MICO|nr:glycoside hydrolase family 43 protein [Agromyces aureus]ANJ26198.1 hypothetical protein ATC03_05105 [Agromyces aureus]
MAAIARNPVLPGCRPDPSICRVDDVFYVVTSSFEYFPGLPVHRSTDLVHWEPVGHAVHREDQLDLSGVASSGGLFAATIRHHAGRFLVVCTLVDDTGRTARRGSFVVTATDAAGPWSDPVWVAEAEGIDPSLFVDRDGRAWWSGTRLAAEPDWPEQTEVWVREFDLATLQLVGEERVVWNGALAGAVWAEGPHLYGIPPDASVDPGSATDVLLLASEGGTERHHAVSVARGPGPLGPFSGSAGNPVLTHRHLGRAAPVANVGHADLVEDGRGGWWATVLATRNLDGLDGLQGRETWLVPVAWEDGWPVFAPGLGRLPDAVEVDWAAEQVEGAADVAGAASVVEARFDGPLLHPDLSLVRTAGGRARARLDERPRFLRLRPSSRCLAEVAPHAFVGLRLEQPSATVTADVEASAAPGLVAGLALRQSEARHVRLELDEGTVALVQHVDGVDRLIGSAEVGSGPGPVTLEFSIEGFAGVARAHHGGDALALGSVDLRSLSSTEAGGFLGVWAGVFATGPESADAFADVQALRIEYRVA